MPYSLIRYVSIGWLGTLSLFFEKLQDWQTKGSGGGIEDEMVVENVPVGQSSSVRFNFVKIPIIIFNIVNFAKIALASLNLQTITVCIRAWGVFQFAGSQKSSPKMSFRAKNEREISNYNTLKGQCAKDFSAKNASKPVLPVLSLSNGACRMDDMIVGFV